MTTSDSNDARRLLRVRCDINEATYEGLYRLLAKIPRKARAERLRVLAHIGWLTENGHAVTAPHATASGAPPHSDRSATSSADIRQDYSDFALDPKEPG